MFRRTVVSRIGVFGLFMKESRRFPALKNLEIPARGRKLGELYRALSPAQLAALKKRARKVPNPPRNPKTPVTRKPTKYNYFVKKHINNFSGTAPSRIKRVAKLWRAAQKKK
jgi:hypothetical protein